MTSKKRLFQSESTWRAGKSPIVALQFVAGQDVLLSIDAERTIQFWNVSEQREIEKLLNPKPPATVCPRGKILAARGDGTGIDIYNLSSGVILQSLSGPVVEDGVVTIIVFSPTGKEMASAHLNQVRLWHRDHEQGEFRLSQDFKYEEAVSAIAFSPSGKMFATATGYKSLLVVDVETGKIRRSVMRQGFTLCLSFSPSGRMLLATEEQGGEHRLRIYDIETGERVRDVAAWSSPGEWLRYAIFGVFSGLFRPNPFAAYSPVEPEIACVFGQSQQMIRILEGDSAKLLQVLRTGQGAVRCLAFSSTGCVLASGGGDGTIRLWRRLRSNRCEDF